jgi:hypothetical protein
MMNMKKDITDMTNITDITLLTNVTEWNDDGCDADLSRCLLSILIVPYIMYNINTYISVFLSPPPLVGLGKWGYLPA